MIYEILLMDGYGVYVWAAFTFTLLSFVSLYFIIKVQFIKEKRKFINKFGTLNSERTASARSQSINKEILSNTSNI